MLRIKFLLPFLLLIFLLNSTTVFAQEVSSVPIETGNIQVQKATGAAFGQGWNFFTLGFDGCNARMVLNEIQADGGSALKVETLFIKDVLGWQSYSILNVDSEKKKIGGGDLLAFNSNQKLFFNMDQKACSNPDKERQAQIDRIGQANAAQGSFIEKVRELPVDMWTKLMDLLNQKNNSVPSQNTDNQSKQSFDNLTVSGKLTVNNLGVTGKIANGLLVINGLDCSDCSIAGNFASINTISNDLYIQNLGVGGINILSGKILIDKEGNLISQSNITAKKYNVDTTDTASRTAGVVVIKAGQTQTDVQTTALTAQSLIFTTPEIPIAVGAKRKDTATMTITIKDVLLLDLKVNWWIVN